MESNTEATQKQQDAIAAFWPRRVSPYITRALVKTPITPNAATALWGGIGLFNSYVVYRALTGGYWFIPVIGILFVLCYLLDCVDGEIARAKNMNNPVGGKLLDGICHRAIEYSLLIAFSAAAATLTSSPWVFLVGMLLLSGEAMYTYVYERRLTTIRIYGKAHQRASRSAEGVFTWGTPFSALTTRQKIRTIVGQVHYKSIYPLIALSYISAPAYLAALVALTAYKHWQWIRLIYSTLLFTATVVTTAPEDASNREELEIGARSAPGPAA